jgi:hypothetical protein
MTYREEYRQDRYRMQDGPRRGDIIGAFTDAVRDNPMSAALIGLGALWLFAGGNRMTLLGGNGRTSIISSAAHGAGSVAHGAGNVASRVGHSVSSGVSSIGETISDTASRATDYVSGSFRGVDAESAYRNPLRWVSRGWRSAQAWRLRCRSPAWSGNSSARPARRCGARFPRRLRRRRNSPERCWTR